MIIALIGVAVVLCVSVIAVLMFLCPPPGEGDVGGEPYDNRTD